MAGKILVAGATGGVGQEVVKQLIDQGTPMRALVREEARARSLLGDVELAVGDTTDTPSLVLALSGIDYVICATGARATDGGNSQAVDYEGVRNLAAAAKISGLAHFVLVSTIFATHHDHPLNQFGRVLEWKFAGENAVRISSVPYTIVRPGSLTDEPGGRRALVFDQGDRISGRITRADVATVCIQSLWQPGARRATFEVIEADGPPPGDWAALFDVLIPDDTTSQ